MADLYLYISATFWGWLGVLLAADGALALVFRMTGRDLPQRVFLWFAIVAVSIAGFTSWRTEHQRAVDAEGRALAAIAHAAAAPDRGISIGYAPHKAPRLWRKHKNWVREALPNRAGCSVKIFVQAGKLEWYDYAEDFMYAFREAGWSADEPTPRVLDSAPHQLWLKANPTDWTAKKLAQMMAHWNLDFDFGGVKPDSEMAECNFELFVQPGM